VDLDRLDTRFPGAAREDEIGTLARGLGAMTARLRASAARLREAERQATLGEVARQVNHDIKNGLTPIRNVVRHLAQVARDTPAELAAIFRERQATLESSVEYLDSLARNYARLTPRLTSAPCDAGAVVTEVVATAAAARRVAIRAEVEPGLPNVLADSAVLRRILENLVGNAVDALDGEDGAVVVSAHLAGHERDAPMVRISVADTGRGMNERELARAFDDFYTTKPGGTGLGLSVVRRLVADLNGVLRIETEPRKGTTVLVDVPMAAGGRDATAPPHAGRNAPAREPRPVVVPGSRPSPE
jgi:signal transduction histidine kinase